MNTPNSGILTSTEYANAPGDGGTSRRRDTGGVAPMRDKSIPNSTTESIPYGYCHCGCGQKTPIATDTVKRRGMKRGEPLAIIPGHRARSRSKGSPGALPFPSTEGNHYVVPLTKGRSALIDAQDVHAVSQWVWSYTDRGYAVASVHGKIIPMHRLIASPPDGMQVDHINRNSLDNRRENLRVCTPGQNQKNRAANSVGTSKFKGVFWDNHKGKWGAGIGNNGRWINLGRFITEIDAARAYDDAALKIHGEFARVNFPNEILKAMIGDNTDA